MDMQLDTHEERQTRSAVRRDAIMRLLRRHRVATGMTIEEVSKKVGVSTGTVSGWESGTHGISPKNLVKFARLLGIHPIELSKIIEPDAMPEVSRA